MTNSNTALLEKAKKSGNPIIDGENVTFIWAGDDPPHLIGDFNHWGHSADVPHTMENIADDVYALTVVLPKDAYVEYAFFSDKDDHETRLVDPLNTQLVDNGLDALNHYFYMPDAIPEPTQNTRDLPQGMMSRHVIKNRFFLAGGERDVWLYKPVATTEPTPLLIVYDGYRSLKHLQITHVIDRLIARKQIPPLALALVDSHEDMRIIEYTFGDAMLIALQEQVFPLAREHLNLLDIAQHPGAFGVCGASMGGLMALYTTLRLPHIFGWAVCQSPSVQILRDDPRSPLNLLLQHHDHEQFPLKLWMDKGTLELGYEATEDYANHLKQHGFNVTFQPFAGGHNITGWRNMLDTALTILIGTT